MASIGKALVARANGADSHPDRTGAPRWNLAAGARRDRVGRLPSRRRNRAPPRARARHNCRIAVRRDRRRSLNHRRGELVRRRTGFARSSRNSRRARARARKSRGRRATRCASDTRGGGRRRATRAAPSRRRLHLSIARRNRLDPADVGMRPGRAILVDWLARRRSPVHAVALPCSSREALRALVEGRAHVAGVHLRDQKSGEYNLAPIRRALGNRRSIVVNFARWELGLATAPGNPLAIRGFADRPTGLENRQPRRRFRSALGPRRCARRVRHPARSRRRLSVRSRRPSRGRCRDRRGTGGRRRHHQARRRRLRTAFPSTSR